MGFFFTPADPLPVPVSRHGAMSFHPSHYCSPTTRLKRRYLSVSFECDILGNCLNHVPHFYSIATKLLSMVWLQKYQNL